MMAVVKVSRQTFIVRTQEVEDEADAEREREDARLRGRRSRRP